MKKQAFTEREIAVMKFICQELTTDEIALKLGFSSKAIDLVRKELLIKTKSKNMVGIAKYAIRNKIYTLR